MTKGTTKRMIIMLLIAALVFGAIYGFQLFRNSMIQKAIKGKGMPPQAVSTIVAQMQSWQPTVEVVGNLRASSGANLSAEVSGIVSAIHFESGANVKAGQVLVELNAAPQIAQLAQLKAAAALAQQTYQRDLAQLKVQALSQAAVDTDAANLKSAQAQVAAQQAVIAQKNIRAPFSGRLGIRQVDLGQYVGPGTALVNLQKLDPMYLDFTVPQAQIDLIRVGETISAKTNALPGKTFSGKIEAIEPQVDTATRTLKVRARFANPHGDLLPGVFATAQVGNGGAQQFITLPNTAVAYNPYGSTVFIVNQTGKDKDGKAQLTVKQRFITTGLTRGDQVAVLTGVQAGETVVTAGQLKLHNDALVFVNNSIKPSNNPNPQVQDE
jgi:membrane fusion protein (multidrug efflux system)